MWIDAYKATYRTLYYTSEKSLTIDSRKDNYITIPFQWINSTMDPGNFQYGYCAIQTKLECT